MLLDKIKADQLSARKEKNEIATPLLTTLYSEALNVGKSKENRASTDDEVVAVIKKFIKSANENKEIYTKSNHVEKISFIEKELSILNQYLPQFVTKEQVQEACQQIINEFKFDKNPSSIGKIMKELKSKFGSQLDASSASTIIKEFLAS